ncbi:hypothetical protein R0744_19575 [Bacillus amyloliquefaciens]|nr:hypothetical protein [Bacillus amyloliquefaciens]WOH97332.1 hypothetical protein R0744_19575 [Bacillus amyloliquefaciens]
MRDNKRSGQTLSVNWPLWEEGGMRVDKETERLMYEQTGMKAMRSASGIQASSSANIVSGLNLLAISSTFPMNDVVNLSSSANIVAGLNLLAISSAFPMNEVRGSS